jgi:hypothetical protein
MLARKDGASAMRVLMVVDARTALHRDYCDGDDPHDSCGTISDPAPGPCGSMIELTWAGYHPLAPNGGGERSSVLDGDTVVIRARAGVVSLAEVVGRTEPARED